MLAAACCAGIVDVCSGLMPSRTVVVVGWVMLILLRCFGSRYFTVPKLTAWLLFRIGGEDSVARKPQAKSCYSRQVNAIQQHEAV